MVLVVSPYHLTSREPPATVALLLGERVVTLLPGPVNGGAKSAARAAERVPIYGELARTWAWAAGLFEAGVLSGEAEGDSPAGDLGRVCEAIAGDPRYSALRTFVREGDYASGRAYLAAISKDILKAGPDPGLSVPVVAALDRFAARSGAVVVRPVAVSVAQRAEKRLGREAFSFAVPVLLQADASRLLHVREVLGRELGALRSAIGEASEEVGEGGDLSGETLTQIRQYASAYAAAFESRRAELFEHAREDEVRVVESTATITGVVLPADAVLRSAVTAMHAMAGASVPATTPSATETLPAIFDPAEGRFVLSLVVKVMGKPNST